MAMLERPEGRTVLPMVQSAGDGGCHGNGDDHCCYVEGEPCMFLGENIVPGRRWACTLLVELGSWDEVHKDPRYLQYVQPVWDAVNERVGRTVIPSCGEWGPGTGQCCYADGDD